MATKIQLRRQTAANWTSDNPVLSSGEVGVETDTVRAKAGDGITRWNLLAYVDDTKVSLTGNETIAGIKTFSSIPVGPATDPTTDNQLTRKAYTDSLVAAALPGQLIWHMPSFDGATPATGVKTVAEMIALGWAVCNGNTPATQTVPASLGTLTRVLTATPDLTTGARFIRAHASTSGTQQAMQTQDHKHDMYGTAANGASNSSIGQVANAASTTGKLTVGINHMDTPSASGYTSYGAETRPINVTAVPLIYCMG